MNGAEPVTYLLDGAITSETGRFLGLAPGLHEVAIADAAGCTFEAQYTLTYDYASVGDDCPCMVYVPTAFTPNNDGHNDAFGVEASCPLTNYHLRIFDRWGRLVFESSDPAEVWVGGDTHWVQSDYFAYTLTYSWGTAEAGGAPAEGVSGTFVVIR
jgi:gliding motility-associated-like protein